MQKTKISTGLVWFTNNLRVHDNDALHRACQSHDQVIAVYCFDHRHFEDTQFGFRKTEKYRAKFLIETVRNLKDNLKDLNITLLIYHDRPENILSSVCEEFKVDALYYQNEWTQEETEVIGKIKESIPDTVFMCGSYTQFLFHPEDILQVLNNIPQVFTAFRKKIEKYVAVRPELSVKKMSDSNLIQKDSKIPGLKELGFPEFETHLNSAFRFPGGETEAFARLKYYIFDSKKIGYYKKTRNGLVGKDYSSKFSPWLANGSLSAKTIYWKVKEFEASEFKNQSTYWLIFELIWRDYFKYVSMKHGNDIFKIGGILKRSYQWSKDKSKINDWIQGETEEPFVNANMLELKNTGWMSNRGRQNVASYFAKDLKLDWRIGAAYFESLLIDYDVHSNYGNWMYVAGVGNDPRDRKFNVQLQAERYDENHKFRNLWLQTSLF
ncbi:MAG: DASH family cryptochrome [Flavobacteriaceae bacterium]|nr:DASH family cryptochrome [Bacteroidia bacterium]NNL16418.1 DASH family cryptochrome [Flavobacteriaceae bacterium]